LRQIVVALAGFAARKRAPPADPYPRLSNRDP
jgi:hypothetical protein